MFASGCQARDDQGGGGEAEAGGGEEEEEGAERGGEAGEKVFKRKECKIIPIDLFGFCGQFNGKRNCAEKNLNCKKEMNFHQDSEGRIECHIKNMFRRRKILKLENNCLH